MHIGHYVFYQITNRFKRQFNRIVSRYNDRTKEWSFTHWNHLRVLIFAQLSGCASLRELVDVIQAHAKRSYNLGFGATTPNRSVISKSNTLRDYRIYEDFAFYMVGQAQKKRITKEFELHGRFYAVDSTTIDLCLSVFRWAHVAIITYCLIGVIEHDHQFGRPIVEVMRILGHSLLVQDDINELLKHPLVEDEKDDDRQLYFEF